MEFKYFNLAEAMSNAQNLAMNKQKMDELANMMQAKEGLRQAVSSGTPESMDLYRRQFPVEARQWDAGSLQLNSAQLINALDRAEYVGQLASGVSDEASYQDALAKAKSAGISVDQAPRNYDPRWVQQTVMQALTVKDRLAMMAKNEQRDRGEYFSPVQTAEGIRVFDHRRGTLLDSASKQKIDKPVIGSASDPNLQGKIAKEKEFGKNVGDAVAAVGGKYEALDSVREAKNILKKGIYSGYWGETQKTLAKATPGIDKNKAANTEEFISYIGNVVVPRLKEFGGNDSNEEMRYLQKIMGGDVSMEDAALENILNSAESKIQKGIERLRKQSSGGSESHLDQKTAPAQPATSSGSAGYSSLWK